MGKKQKKPGKGKEKTERKTVKSLEKKVRREEKFLAEEDDIDAILAKIKEDDAKKVAVEVDEGVPRPTPRCNFSLTLNPLKETELIFFGGEYYNGDKTYVYGDLYRYSIEKDEWKLVSSPNSPPPRSAHQAVAWKNFLYIFGGEFTSPNQERFHHYKDFWRLDLNTNAWEQLHCNGGPSPRSGHRMILWKHQILLFGGFYDTLREVKYYNDFFVFNLDDQKWVEVKQRPGSAWPSPRSACQLAVHADELFVYGGYFKAPISKKQEKEDAEKGEVLGDMWILDLTMWEWNKVRKLGSPPEARAGFSLAVHKKRAVVFGGVVDVEKKDVIQSKFLNDFFAFQMDSRRWFTLQLRKPKTKKIKDKNKLQDPENDNQEEEISSTFEEEKLELSSNSENLEAQFDKKLAISEEELPPSEKIEDSTPCGRMNAAMAVSGNNLILFGGLMEVGDKEVTLDDMYILDLVKLDSWRCVMEASHSEWVEVDDEDEVEDEGTFEQTVEKSGEKTGELSEEEEEEEEEEVKEGEEISSEVQNAASILRGEGKKLGRKERKEEMERIRNTLGLSDPNQTPQLGETLREFFVRTSLHWQHLAYGRTQNVGKELRRDGFDLCETRYMELRPLMVELERLEMEQKEEEEAEKKKEKENKGRRQRN